MRLRRPRLPWKHGPWIDYTKYLPPGERTRIEVRKHPAALLWPVCQAVLAWILFIWIHAWLDLPSESTPIDTILGIVSLAVSLRAAWMYFEWRIERVLVTNKRIVEVSGIITDNVASMHLSKVTDLTYRRGPLEKIFNYGELILESAGQNQALESITYIPRPDEFYRDFMELLNDALGGGLTQPPGGGGSDDDTDTGEIPRVRL